jgi:hypothetical protein
MDPALSFLKTFGQLWFHSSIKKKFVAAWNLLGVNLSPDECRNEKRPGKPGRFVVRRSGEEIRNPSD